MKFTKIAVLLFVGGVITYWLFFLTATDEFHEIRVRYRELLEEATVGPNTPVLERLFKAKRVAAAFDDKVEGQLILSNGDAKSSKVLTKKLSRKGIENQLIAAYRVSKEVRPEIVNDAYSKEENGIQLMSTLRVYGDKPGQEQMYLEELKIQLLFENKEGDWLIEEATIERVSRD